MARKNKQKIAEAIEDVHAHYMFSRVKVMQVVPKNPFGAASRILHGRYCSSLKNPSSVLLNRAGGFQELNEQELHDVIDWYSVQDASPRVTVIPEFQSASFLKLLRAKQFKISKMWNSAELYAEIDSIVLQEIPADIQISVPKNRIELETFSQIYIDSFHFPTKLKDGMRENIKRLSRSPNTQLYIAYLDQKPAAAGILHIRGRVGYLAMTGTLRKFRGKGLHRALIQRRMADAKKAKVKLISGSASIGSTSQRNMKRCGLNVSLTQQTWVRE